jgi:hypothetical protein
MNHKLNDASAVEAFLKLDEWEARHGEGPYEKSDVPSVWLVRQPAPRPSRIGWMLVGAILTLVGYLIAI